VQVFKIRISSFNIYIGFKATGIHPLNKDWLLIEKNKEKLDIHQSFKTNLNSKEKFDLFVRSYNIDEQLDSESLDSLNLFYKSKSISEFEVEINKDRCFLSNLDKFLNEKEAKICMNFDHINKKKRKRDVFEDSTNSSVLNDSERLEKLKKYFDEKATISRSPNQPLKVKLVKQVIKVIKAMTLLKY
jgi:hypothetical protein